MGLICAVLSVKEAPTSEVVAQLRYLRRG